MSRAFEPCDLANDHTARLSLNDYPSKNENEWAVYAIVGAILAFIGTIGAGIWVFSHYQDLEKAERLSRALAPFLLSIAAFASFLTIVWRSTIASNQVNEAKRQNDLAEEGKQVDRLEAATSLLAKSDSPSKAVAITMLDSLAKSSNENIAEQALNLLALERPLVWKTFRGPERRRLRDLLNQTIERAQEIKRECSDHLRFDYGGRKNFQRHTEGSDFLDVFNLDVEDLGTNGTYSRAVINMFSNEAWERIISEEKIECEQCYFKIMHSNALELRRGFWLTGRKNVFSQATFKRIDGPSIFIECDLTSCHIPVWVVQKSKFISCTYLLNFPPFEQDSELGDWIHNHGIMPKPWTENEEKMETKLKASGYERPTRPRYKKFN